MKSKIKTLPSFTKELSLLDRLMLPSILKTNDVGIKTITLNKDIKKKVSLVQDDFRKYEITQNENGSLAWNKKGAQAKFKIAFTELEYLEIKLRLEKANTDEKLSEDHESLYFVFFPKENK